MNTHGFLLTRQWRDTPSGLEFVFWGTTREGPIRIVETGQEAVCFIHRDAIAHAPRRAPLELKALDGHPVDGLYFPSQRRLLTFRDSIPHWHERIFEGDVRPEDRYLMERYVRGSFSVSGRVHACNGYREFTNPTLAQGEYDPTFKIASLDIETEGLEGALYSIAVVSEDVERVFMVGEAPDTGSIRYVSDEKTLLEGFFHWFHELDPDLIVGWNLVGFDLWFLQQKCLALNLPFDIGRGRERAFVLESARPRQPATAKIPGRVALDGIELLKLAHYLFERFTLSHVAVELLGKDKLIGFQEGKVEEIRRLFREDKPALAAYNLQDCRLVLEIFEHADLVNFAVQRSRMTGLPLDRYGGSVAAFDFLYLPELHRAGYVAPSIGMTVAGELSPGGYILDPVPGIHENVLVLDYKSLYPSIIRTFKIDPLGMVVARDEDIEGYAEARFSRSTHILPQLVADLWAARDAAKRRKDKALAQAIKIIMNSFYGVLGSTGCRFYHPKLASSITRFGHHVIRESKTFIENEGFQVIYGDTDSVFVLLGSGYDGDAAVAVGQNLAGKLNAWWTERLRDERGIASHLEVEFETHYERFLMPTMRGSERGSKKRYAGLVRGEDGVARIEVKGLESIRTDWTPVARRFQYELFRRLFMGEPVEDFIRDTASDVLSGAVDDDLVYRKRLRKELDEYTSHVPPHVQAARKLDKPGEWVDYVITLNGPEPAEHRVSPIDYGHYLDRQLAPVADTILQFYDTSFAALTDRQMQMFET